ncbi:MAG: hypothetical protein EXS36_08215 [Pedosphaera sp.]|nr:hypothetical protein [Pedosphaera sp.]
MIDTRDPVGVGAPYGSSGGDWGPAMWHNEMSVPVRWNAKNLGEVFGIALDDSTPPNVYVTATSIYYENGRDPGGDGGVYKLSGSTFGISVFQDFSASSKKIGKASLGNICFDKAHRQVFVTDLDNGLIRRLSNTGSEIVTVGVPYDHGITGIPNVDGTQIPDASSVPGDLTSSGRRVFGVQVYQSRLYYSVWWAPVAGGPGMNEVWSVSLQPNGDLVSTGPKGPKKEFSLLGLLPNSGYPTSEPVITDIAFSQSCTMLIGERSICATTPTDLASESHSPQAIEYAFGTSWTQSQILNVGKLVEPSGRVKSAGGVDYDCEGHPFVTGDALINDSSPFPYTGNAVYGLQIFPTPISVVSNSWVIDFDGSYTTHDKLSLGDVEVNRCCDCLTFHDERIECLATNTFQWSFCITNTGTFTNGHLVFLDLPPGVTINPPIIDINPPLAPGQGFSTKVIITIDPKQTTNQLCFRNANHQPDYADCCIVAKCLKVPDCCAVISKEVVKCDAASGSISWIFNLQNLSGVPRSIFMSFRSRLGALPSIPTLSSSILDWVSGHPLWSMSRFR